MRSMKIFSCASFIFLVATISIISSSTCAPIEAANSVGFSVDLIHRDSPQSPLYNPELSRFQRLNISYRRSLQQIGSTNIISDGGEYLMKISYGTPPFEVFSCVDTGSYLSWIQCLPCIHCYPSDIPPFNPKNSRTYHALHEQYHLPYEDGRYSEGEFARDTITIAGSNSRRVSFPNFLFGCGHNNVGHNFPRKGSGFLGFGPQPQSFITQLSSMIHGKFSFCMAPAGSNPAGKISFGNEAVVSGPGVVTTPLIIDEHYSIVLDGVTVGRTRLDYFPSSNNNSRKVNGRRIVIDSGATLTHIPNEFQIQVEVNVRKQIRLPPARAVLPYTLCYPSSLRDADIPKITFHFAGGANVELDPVNTFDEGPPNTRCLAILPLGLGFDIPIFGNVAQTNFLVGYDLANRRVSFKKTDCSRR